MTRILILVALFSAVAPAQPIEAKLDHVQVAVHDLEAARLLYAALGFSMRSVGRHPTGTANSSMHFTESGYIELITAFDATLPGGKTISEFTKKGDGGADIGLAISSADQAAKDLRGGGFRVDGPNPGTVMRAGDKEPPPTLWWSVGFSDRAASRPVFMIQYLEDQSARHFAAGPNAVSSLASVLIAVNDPDKAVAGYSNLGRVSPGQVKLPEFGATAKEIVLARGSILLLKATSPNGPTAQQLNTRGEGVFAIRLAVTDLDQARKAIGGKNVSKDTQNVLVAPGNASGVWLQFVP